MRYVLMTIFALTISALTSTANGSMITFTQTGISDGYYLDTRYDDKPYVFTATGDLSKVHSGGWFGHEYPGYQVDLIAASITVEGMGTVNLPSGYYSFTVSPTHPTYLYMNVTGPDPWTEMSLISPVFSGWDMKTSLPPVALETFLGIDYPKINEYPYEYRWDFHSEAIFSATVAPVPEPSTIMLLAGGVMALLIFGKHGSKANVC